MMYSNRRCSTSNYGKASKGTVDLPMEIISEILCRLPIESILTCQFVCKTWYGVTRDPCFVNKHSHFQPTQLILKPWPCEDISDASSHLVLVDIEEHKARRIPIEKSLLGLDIMCFCNGLFCLALGSKADPVVIYNPITRENVFLPSSGSKFDYHSHKVGLGFDLSSGKYKVVRACRFVGANGKTVRFEIISLGDSSWRGLSVPQSMLDFIHLEVVFWNGSLFWKLTLDKKISIVEFNLSNEKFTVISLPENLSQPREAPQLIDLGGCLTIVEHASEQIKLWRLTRNESGGDLSFCLQHAYDTHVMWGSAVYHEVMTESNHNSYILKVEFRRSRRGSFSFNHLTQYFPLLAQYRHLDIPGLPDGFTALGFKPSLVSPLAASRCFQ
ncbi:F-box protein [Actinidia chinensis var. chinensis]|uniref:F-box protein n=1 Tax=Actinidia chinensis var. chinensis TaxID=1590841 RepID=A0A2R6PV18_ACTCC|nr:F-box protein [Actinidia chinensis var. chinensis]